MDLYTRTVRVRPNPLMPLFTFYSDVRVPRVPGFLDGSAYQAMRARFFA
jgi:hypothetical protein